MNIRPYATQDYERVLAICVAAFTPIHQGFENVLGGELFSHEYRDWRRQYAEQIAGIPDADPEVTVHVVEDGGTPVAFMFTIVDEQTRIGEIGLNAVDPARQGEGIGKLMYAFALEDLKKRGARFARVGTGGDAAHAPARAAYAAVGFDRAIPAMYLFRKL